MVRIALVRPASEDEVVLAFLRGEFASERFGVATRAALGREQLVTDPDLTSAAENDARRAALGRTRGWGLGTELFDGFPDDVTWTFGTLAPDELCRVEYIDYSYWNELSGGSRRPADVRATLEADRFPAWMRDLGLDRWYEAATEVGDRLDDLIVVGPPGLERLVLVEGHARLTALFMAGREREVEVTAYLGVSPTIDSWGCF
jgi:hypothetical protein